MKIAFTIADCSHYANAGGEVERTTYVMDVPDEVVPPAIRQLLADRADEIKRRERCYESVSLSLVVPSVG